MDLNRMMRRAHVYLLLIGLGCGFVAGLFYCIGGGFHLSSFGIGFAMAFDPFLVGVMAAFLTQSGEGDGSQQRVMPPGQLNNHQQMSTTESDSSRTTTFGTDADDNRQS